MKSCSQQKLFLILECVTLEVLPHTLKFSIYMLCYMFLIVGLPKDNLPFL